MPSRVPGVAQVSTASLLVRDIAIIPLILAFGGRSAVTVRTLVDLLLRVTLAILRIGVHARSLLVIAS